jgi:hypothetical protein
VLTENISSRSLKNWRVEMKKIKVSTRDVFTTSDKREFFTVEAAIDWESKLLVSKLENHCLEFTPECESSGWITAKESLQEILILLRDNGITSKAKMQKLIDFIEEASL